jgi:hypothetical protein
MVFRGYDLDSSLAHPHCKANVSKSTTIGDNHKSADFFYIRRSPPTFETAYLVIRITCARDKNRRQQHGCLSLRLIVHKRDNHRMIGG